MTRKHVKKWYGSKLDKCDFCRADLTKQPTFIDGRTKRGSWAIMCEYCHMLDGVGLGTGKGQKYDSKTLVKLEG